MNRPDEGDDLRNEGLNSPDGTDREKRLKRWREEDNDGNNTPIPLGKENN